MLLSLDRITHWRRINTLTRVEVPQRLAGLRLHSLKVVGIVCKKNHAARCCHGSTGRESRTHLRVLPGKGFSIEIVGQKKFLWMLCRIVFDTGRVIGLSLGKFLWFAEKSAAVFE